MSWFKAGQIAFMAYEAVKDYVQKSTEQKIRAVVVQLVRERLDTLVVEINRRTLLYILLSIAALAILVFGHLYPQHPKAYVAALVVLLLISALLLSRTVMMLHRWLGYLEHLDTLVGEALQEHLQRYGDEGLYKKALVWLSERNQADYRDQVIVEIVRSISSWLRHNKTILVVRLVFLTLFILTFGQLLQVMLKRFI